MGWHTHAHVARLKPNVGQSSLIQEAIGALETAFTDETLFLWTGGKEAQVIADLLLYSIGGGNGMSPVDFGVIDTGNHFDEMYEFRREYCSRAESDGADLVGPLMGIDNIIVERYDELLDGVINNDKDPRGYHGRHDGSWKCPECGIFASIDHEDSTITCDRGHEYKLPFPRSENTRVDEWDWESSCQALKVVPIRKFVDDYGYSTIITGRRTQDPLTPDEDSGGLEIFRSRNKPVPHERVNPLANWSEENVYAYIKKESVKLPSLYTDQGYRHTDSVCCTDEDARGEYGEGGRDPEKLQARKKAEEMGYV